MPSQTYPPTPPTVSGDFITISRWLAQPTLIQRALRTIADQRFIADRILSERVAPSGGAIQYEQNESIFPEDAVESVAPGEEFPLSGLGAGTTVIEAVRKWGLDTIITDESIRRRGRNPVDRGIQKLANGIVQKGDSVALAKLDAAPVQTLAGADWTAAATDIVAQIATAQMMIRQQNQGFEADTLVVDDARWLDLMTDEGIRNALPRENPGNNPVITGQAPGQGIPLLGLRQILVTPNIPTANTAWVLDSRVLGGLAEEVALTTQSIRDEERQRWRLRAYRIFTAYVNEPQAAVRITGV